MDSQRSASQEQHAWGSDIKQRPMPVHSDHHLPSEFPPPADVQSPRTNGVARATSKRRRASGGVYNFTMPDERSPRPPAPEVPKAPPVSYRPPYNPEDISSPTKGYPSPSFSERAQALTNAFIPTHSPGPVSGPLQQPVKPVRRGSLNRPIGGVYSEIQQHKRDSYPPRNGPGSPRRFSNPVSPAQDQSPSPYPSSREATHRKPAKPPTRIELPQHQSESRRASTGLVQAHQKEWAPDRSPLQNLEVKLSDISKEEKRARVQEAEQRLRDSQSGTRLLRPGQENESSAQRGSSKRVSAMLDQPDAKFTGPHPNKAPVGSEPSSKTSIEDNYLPARSQSREANKASQGRAHRESLQIGPHARTLPARDMPDQKRSLGLEDSRRAVAQPRVASQKDQQPERGVRFYGEDHAGGDEAEWSDYKPLEPSNFMGGSGIAALAKSDEARTAQRNQYHQKSSPMTNPTSTKGIPKQQQNLYKSRLETPRNDASAAKLKGVEDPVPRHTVHGHNSAPNYEVQPQTAAGVRARQTVDFSSQPNGQLEMPVHRKHHLSDVLHLRRHQDQNAFDRVGNEPRHLDEWRRAGTARLTAADFAQEDESEKGQNAWWEGGGSGSRRKPHRVNNREAKSLQVDYQDGIGKLRSLVSHEPRQQAEAKAYQVSDRGIRTRQYLREDEYEGLKEGTYQPSESHLTHFLHRLGHDQTHGLSSAYSYSCPDLANHDPSHENHICEPYMSKELIQSMRSVRIRSAPDLSTFDPPLYLKCGPLLRYTGLKRDRRQMKARSGGTSSIERETWRGSVMIITADADSYYDPVPTLRLFPEPMEILPPPSDNLASDNVEDLPSEYVDPVAGLPKLSRSGKTIYVKPVDDLEHAKDLSRLENDDGLFEETRTAAVPTAYGTPDFRASSTNPKSVRHERRPAKRGQQVKGVRLHVERGVTFWRFNLEVELGVKQTRIAYSINNSPSVGFWVPARGQSMNMMFHSCNGFSMSVK